MASVLHTIRLFDLGWDEHHLSFRDEAAATEAAAVLTRLGWTLRNDEPPFSVGAVALLTPSRGLNAIERMAFAGAGPHAGVIEGRALGVDERWIVIVDPTGKIAPEACDWNGECWLGVESGWMKA